MNNLPDAIKKAWWGLVRFGFRLLYNEIAFTYDTVSRVVSMGQWRDWGRSGFKHLNVPPGSRILELAHGTGNIELDLHAAGYDTTAIDLSKSMGHIARRKLCRQGINPPLIRARGQALPFAAQTFPAAISTFPTEFIVDPVTLAEVNRVLRPGGRLVIVFNGVLTRRGAAGNALELAYRVTGQRGPWPVKLEERFVQAGFRVEAITESLPRSQVLLFVAVKIELPHP